MGKWNKNLIFLFITHRSLWSTLLRAICTSHSDWWGLPRVHAWRVTRNLSPEDYSTASNLLDALVPWLVLAALTTRAADTSRPRGGTRMRMTAIHVGRTAPFLKKLTKSLSEAWRAPVFLAGWSENNAVAMQLSDPLLSHYPPRTTLPSCNSGVFKTLKYNFGIVFYITTQMSAVLLTDHLSGSPLLKVSRPSKA